MRKSGICTKCGNNQLLSVGAVADTGDYADRVRPMSLAMMFTRTGFFGDELHTRAGRLSAMVCKACGYTELYVLDPEAIKPDGKYVTEVNGPAPTSPFR